MTKSQELYNKAKKIIPGGTQLLSKRPEMFLPNKWPAYYSKAKGCQVWDLDGNEYLDTSFMGIGANILGYANDEVNSAVQEAVDFGSMCTLNAPEEVELGEKMKQLHPWMDMIRYAKSGGEAVSIAVRIARAYTGKEIILFCGYHGWSDWYLAANLAEDSALDGHLLSGLNPKGVPRGLIGTSIPFSYNNLDEFRKLIQKNTGKIAAVVMEPIRNDYPENGFLEEIRKITKEQEIILIFDEITSGFRLCNGGAHKVLGVDPDMATFGKAISNGYPMAAILGKRKVMEAAQDTFISSTYWTDRVGLKASVKTIEMFEQLQLEEHLQRIGKLVQDGWTKCAKDAKLDVHVSGIYPLGHFSFNNDNAIKMKTLFTQEMLKRGFLATTAFYVSYAHSEEIVTKYLKAVKEVFQLISAGVENGTIEELLDTEPCHTGFKRLI